MTEKQKAQLRITLRYLKQFINASDYSVEIEALDGLVAAMVRFGEVMEESE